MSKFQFGEANKDQTKANEKAESAVNTSEDSTSSKVVDNKDVSSASVATAAISSELVAGSPPPLVKTSGTVKNAVVNKIEATVPFVGQERQSGEHHFQVQLEGEPAEEVFAKDRLEAQQRYSARLGIISTTRAFRISTLD